jgi:hypothetical protein
MKHPYLGECPGCNRKSLVQRREGHYQCLSCNFEKDLETPEPANLSTFLLAIVFAIFMTALMQSTKVDVPLPEYPSAQNPQSFWN